MLIFNGKSQHRKNDRCSLYSLVTVELRLVLNEEHRLNIRRSVYLLVTVELRPFLDQKNETTLSLGISNDRLRFSNH